MPRNPNQNLLDVLTREGVLSSGSVRYWRAAKKLNPQDLGLDPNDILARQSRSLASSKTLKHLLKHPCRSG